MNRTESGRREALACVLPYDSGRSNHRLAVDSLKRDISTRLGGYTSTPFEGGWLEGADLLRETGERVEVSYPTNGVDREWLRARFVRAGRETGNTWIHIERREFFAEHTHVDHYPLQENAA